MNITIALAQILGILFVGMGLSVLFSKKIVVAVIENEGMIWLTGFITMGMGAVIIALHSVWDGGLLKLIITIMGWLCVAKGAFLLIFPNAAISFYKKVLRSDVVLTLSGVVAILAGLVLLYKGFM